MRIYLIILLILLVSCDSGFKATNTGATENVEPPPSLEPETNDETEPEVVPPEISVEDLIVVKVSADSTTLQWNKSHVAVKYRVCLKTGDKPLSTLAFVTAACEGSDWLGEWQDTTTFTLTELQIDTSYKAAVVAWHEETDTKASNFTVFKTADVAPEPTGAIAISAQLPISARLTWPAAQDDVTESERLEYRVCLTKGAPIEDIDTLDSLCQWQSRWSRGLTEINIYGLMPSKSYLVSVVIRDLAGNQALMKAVEIATPVAKENTFYVDDDFTISADQGSAGLDAGDTVVFAAGAFEENSGLVYGINAFGNMADALAADTGGSAASIMIAPGTFVTTATLTPTADTDFIGSGADATIIQHNFDATSESLIRLNSGINSVVANLTIDASNNLAQYGVDCRDCDLVAANNAFREIKVPGYNGAGVLAFGKSSYVKVINNYFEEMGRMGLWNYSAGDGNMFQWNHFKGAVLADSLNYAVDSDSSADLLVVENYFHDLMGVAGDGSESTAVGLFSSIDNTGSATVKYNVIENVKVASFAAYGGAEVGDYQYHFNIIKGAQMGIVNASSALTVDATNNYWGDATGPMHADDNPDGLGAPLSGLVDFAPFLTSEVLP